jgi:hypothetical protein
MTKTEMIALLGRPLTPVEDTNFSKYLNIATESLEELICTLIEDVEETRTYDLREGYSTAFVDIFHDVSEVKIDGEVIDSSTYSARQWDRRNGSWYNSLVFDDPFTPQQSEIEITAEWGFQSGSGEDSDLPLDLQAVLAGLFAQITKKNKYDPTISSKQVEDFRISFRADADLDEEFYNKYRRTISKYSLCHIGNLQSGKVKKWRRY